MAQPDIIRGTYFALMMGDGGGPETFVALCGITTRDFTQQANTSDQYIRDCASPEDEPIRRLIVTGKQWDLTGSGVLNRSNLALMNAAWSITKNYRYVFTEPSGDLVYQGYYSGPAILTQIKFTAEDANYAQISVNIASDGAWTWTTV